MVEQSARQKDLYESIHDAYEDHYYDADSMAYRERYYYDPLFQGLDLNGADVVELASGSGHNSVALLRRYPRARLIGLDISSAACEAYRRNVGTQAIEVDLTKPTHIPRQFDAAMILGGLHHCVVDLPAALANVARLVKPGGVFLMLEPNRRFILEWLRRLWYRADGKYFDAATEAALDHDDIAALARGSFSVQDVRHLGGPAYFLISQSLLFRIPKKVKSAIRPPLMAFESIYNSLAPRNGFPYFVARWRRVNRE